MTDNNSLGWTPIEERLPETDGMYIVTIYDGVCEIRLSWYLHGMWIDSGTLRSLATVTAWMPLLEPYDQNKEE